MFARLGRRPWALGWLLVLAGWSYVLAAPPAEEQLRAWIQDLDADDFAKRDGAAGRLAAAGPIAVPLLSESLKRGSPEAAWRASAVLSRIREAGIAVQGAAGTETAAAGSACNDQSPPAEEAATLPPAPEPPPESDIALALAPPPEPLPVDAVTDRVLIADAYVSPELAVEVDLVEPNVERRVSRPIDDVPRLPERKIEHASRTPVSPPVANRSSITLVRYPAERHPLASGRENQPRVKNFFHRARTVLGLPAR
jgi:hypothetical protein